MRTFEKINFLMEITNTSNTVLGKYLTFDASYISRIRNGKRSLPKDRTFIDSLSLFFSEHILNDYQKKVAGEFIAFGKEWPDQPHIAKNLIYSWLSEELQENTNHIGNILSDISSVHSTEIPPIAIPPSSTVASTDTTQYFYGDEGKRTAVALFLSELGQMEHPPRLLLYSNEEFNWMYEDPKFAQQWAMLLFSYIKKGGKIKIAHTISRASGEMLMALQKWIPVYMTGAVEPYYYPKILDRIFRKTMFIAEGHSAIVAGSVGEHTDHGMNILLKDPTAIKVLENEFWDFLDLCKPLMQIFNVARKEAFFDVLRDFYKNCENTITVRTTPSFYTMPSKVAQNMNQRLDHNWIIKRQENGEKEFRRMMSEGKTLTEIVNLPKEELIKDHLPFPMCDLFDKPGLYYTTDEFKDHLDNIITLLKENKNYHVILSSAVPQNEIVYVKEDTSAIVVKSDFPSIAFSITEPRMVAAFWDYLTETQGMARTKQDSIRQLEKLKDRL